MKAPKGTGVPKSSGQGVSRYTYQQAYKLRANSPMGPGMKASTGKRGAGGLAPHMVEDMVDDRFATGSTPYFKNVLNAMTEKS